MIRIANIAAYVALMLAFMHGEHAIGAFIAVSLILRALAESEIIDHRPPL